MMSRSRDSLAVIKGKILWTIQNHDPLRKEAIGKMLDGETNTLSIIVIFGS